MEDINPEHASVRRELSSTSSETSSARPSARALFRMGAKRESPHNGELLVSDRHLPVEEDEDEEPQVQLSELYAAIARPRVFHRRDVSVARWLWDRQLAEVDVMRGKVWANTGIIRDSRTLCHVEETLYLVERGSLLLQLGADDPQPASVQQTYALLDLPGGGCFWEAYAAYAYLRRLGYIVGRCRVPWIYRTPDVARTFMDHASCTTSRQDAASFHARSEPAGSEAVPEEGLSGEGALETNAGADKPLSSDTSSIGVPGWGAGPDTESQSSFGLGLGLRLGLGLDSTLQSRLAAEHPLGGLESGRDWRKEEEEQDSANCRLTSGSSTEAADETSSRHFCRGNLAELRNSTEQSGSWVSRPDPPESGPQSVALGLGLGKALAQTSTQPPPNVRQSSEDYVPLDKTKAQDERKDDPGGEPPSDVTASQPEGTINVSHRSLPPARELPAIDPVLPDGSLALVPMFDVYRPNSAFKKRAPGDPLFSLCIASTPPTQEQVQTVVAQNKGVPIKFAAVAPGLVSIFAFETKALPHMPS